MPNYISKLNLNGTEREIKDPNAVSFSVTQSLSEEQKTRARANIGASGTNIIVPIDPSTTPTTNGAIWITTT